MKKLIVLLMIIASLSIITACQEDEAGDKITIDFWHMSPVGSTSYSGMRQIIKIGRASCRERV